MSPLEIVGAIVSAYGVWLMARRSLWCWPVNIVGVALYFWIFYQAKLYSDMMLQAFYLAANVYGWFQWKHGEVPDGTIAIAVPPPREMVLGILAGVVGAVALGYAMAHLTDAAAPWIDSTLTSYSFVAQIWSARRFIESWWLWITLDVFYIGLFIFKNLYPTAVLYFVLMILCFLGLADWRRASRA